MLTRTWLQWLALTILTGIFVALLDAIFNTNTPMSFAELGFIAFVSIWCAKQDEAKRCNHVNNQNR